MAWKFGITWQMIFLPCFASPKDAFPDLFAILQLRKQLEDQCFPSVLLIKKIDPNPRRTWKQLKAHRFEVLGRDAVSFEGQVMTIHT